MQEKLEKYLELKINEDKINNNYLNKMKGRTVRYGDDISLMHIDSEHYVKSCRDTSETSVIGTKCILSDKLDTACCFKIFSRYKSKKIGDSISLDDEVLIFNTKQKQFLDFDDTMFHNAYDFNGRDEDPFRPTTYFQDPYSQFHKILLSIRKNKYWSFRLFFGVKKYFKKILEK